MILRQQESRPLEERMQPDSFALDIQKDSCCLCKVPENADGFTSPGTGGAGNEICVDPGANMGRLQ